MTTIDKPPVDVQRQVFLQQSYDDWRFLIVNIWREFAGGWDQNPAHLLPAREEDVAREVAMIAGGARKLVAFAEAAAKRGQLELATQLVQWAGEAAPADKAVHSVRADIYKARRERETPLMVQSIFSDAEQQSRRVVDNDGVKWSGMPYIESSLPKPSKM